MTIMPEKNISSWPLPPAFSDSDPLPLDQQIVQYVASQKLWVCDCVLTITDRNWVHVDL